MSSQSGTLVLHHDNRTQEDQRPDTRRFTVQRYYSEQLEPRRYEPHAVPDNLHPGFVRPPTPVFPTVRAVDNDEHDPSDQLSGKTSFGGGGAQHNRVPPTTPMTAIFDIPAINKPGRLSSYTLQSVYPQTTPTNPTHDTTDVPWHSSSQPYDDLEIDLEKDPSVLTHPPEIKMSTPREILFIAVVAISHLMTQAALGQALAPIDIISASFENGTVSPGEQSWFIAAYALTVGTFILISGRLGDNLGHKRVFAFGYAWFGIWSGFTGFSVYPGRQIFFDICRAMQGIGPALLLPNALALFGRAYPAGLKKNIVFSIFGAVAPMGFVLGATFGSLFSQLLWWPWAFWSFGLTCLILSLLVLLITPKELSTLPKNPVSFDIWGSIFGVAGLILLNVAVNNAPLYGWDAGHVIFTLILALTSLLAFVGFEIQAKDPILPLRALTPTAGYALALVGLGWGAFGIWVFYLVRFLQHIRLSSPLLTSAYFAPAVPCGLLAAGLTGFLLTHTPISFTLLISTLAFLTGTLLTTFLPVAQTYWAQTFLAIVIMPFGMDCSFPAATLVLSNALGRDKQGLAAGLVTTVVNYSVSIALGVAGSVEVHSIGHAGTGGEALVTGIMGMEIEWLVGWRWAMITACGLSGGAVILGFIFFARSTLREGWKVENH